jgi:5,10-methylenetetrahydromethanopterin reductase
VRDFELGLGFQSNKSPEEYIRLARLGEELGFEVLSVYGDLFYQPPIYPLLMMALNTHAVRLGPACFNPFTLHPVEMAGQTAALDAVSGGRAFLGVARGSWLDRLGMTPSRPLTALEDALEVVRRLLRGDTTGYNGQVFGLEPEATLAYPVKRADVPVMIGTWSRHAARLAARFADEVKIGGSANTAMLRQMRDWLAEDLPQCGRQEHEVGVVMGAVTVVDLDGHEARRRAKREVAMYLDVVLELDPTVQAPDGLAASLRHLVKQGDPEAAGRLIPDDMLDLFAFAGTPEQVSLQVEALARAGARRVDFGTPHGLVEDQGIRLLGERMLPNFRLG